MERPKRWDIPFSRDLGEGEERREMTDPDLFHLLLNPPFSGMNPNNFPSTIPLDGILRNDTRIRKYRNGDVVVRQGDYGNSAFLILGGKVRVILEGLDPVALGRKQRRERSWVRSFLQPFVNPALPELRDSSLYPQMRKEHPAATEAAETVLLQDVTNVLRAFPDAFERTDNTIMRAGELFGELGALGRIPRAATVVAEGDAELLEIRWQGLRDLRKYDEALRKHTDDQYRRYGLAATLQSSPLLAGLRDTDLEKVAVAAQFETHGQFDWYGTYRQLRQKEQRSPLSMEPVIFEEGSYPNGLVLIRAGFARLSRKYGNGERTFGYLGRGGVYGLAELVHNARIAEPVPLRATLRAVGYVDVVIIPTRTFEELILPKIPTENLPVPSLEAAAGEEAVPRPSPGGNVIDPAMLEFLVENRLINGTATMIIDLDRCIRCDECVRACSVGHNNNPRFVRHGKIFDHYMIANACMHCQDPVCMIGCPTGAIHRDQEGGQVVINDITCIGCGTCAASCPYDNIRMVEVRDRRESGAIMIDPERGRAIVKATKCDLCVDHDGGPACQRACPHDALVRMDMRDTEFLTQW
ncbi:MAG: cyclic nucleotide-binding domain-containing protein, partial [Candidatus Binatia bacterium]